MKYISLLFFLFFGTSCAVLHHVQVGQIDSRPNEVAIPFEILMSEMGVSTDEIRDFSRAASQNANNALSQIADVVALFQIGPRTGNQVYNERYAEKLIYEIHQKCPSGRVTSLVSIRETRKYPVISGEIVKVTGQCLKTKKTSELENSEIQSKGIAKR